MANASSSSRESDVTAISCLCRVLCVSKLSGVLTPPTIHQAVCNDSECVGVMWRALLDVKSACDNHWMPHPCHDATSSVGEDDITSIKSWLLLQGYNTPHILSIPRHGEEEDRSQHRGEASRELLLAFSWLLSTTSVIDKVVERIVGSYTNTPPLLIPMPATTDMGVNDVFDVAAQVEHMMSLNAKSRCQYLLWLYARLRHEISAKHAATEHLIKLIDACNQVGIDSLSQVGIGAARSNRPISSSSSGDVGDVASENVVLEAYIDWKQAEESYYEFMEAVYERSAASERRLRRGGSGSEWDRMDRRRNKVMRSNMRRAILSAREQTSVEVDGTRETSEAPAVDVAQVLASARDSNLLCVEECSSRPVRFVTHPSAVSRDAEGCCCHVSKLTEVIAERRSQLASRVSTHQRDNKTQLESILLHHKPPGAAGRDIAVVLPSRSRGGHTEGGEDDSEASVTSLLTT